MEEAMQAIDEKLYLGPRYMDSPRSAGDKNFRVSTARVHYVDGEESRLQILHERRHQGHCCLFQEHALHGTD
eukprot:6591086-Heterocapsa_arctica.AAC.1